MKARRIVIVVGSVLMGGACLALLAGYFTAGSQAPQVLTADQPCVPPPGFVDTPRPTVAPIEELVSHTEEIIIDRPLAAALEIEAKTKLEDAINKNSSLPHVTGTYMLTPGEFGVSGSRRLTCLSDRSTLVEESLENGRNGATARFRYLVWNYTSEQARPIVYGVGDFLRSDIGSGRTHVRWTYSFQLNRGRFPGMLGSLGDFLFRRAFLDRSYADMMRRSLAGSKTRIESLVLQP